MIYGAWQMCLYLRLPKVTPDHTLDFKKAERRSCKKEVADSEKKIYILSEISSGTMFWMVSQLLRLDPFCSIYNLCSRRWKHPKILIVQLHRWKEMPGDQTGTAITCVSWRLEKEFGLWKLFWKCFPFRFIDLVPCFWSRFTYHIITLKVLQRESPGLCPDPLQPLAATT